MATRKQEDGAAPSTARTNRVLESQIQKEICEFLEFQGFFFWRSNNVPVFAMSNDGVRRFRSLPKHTPRGLPDIMVVTKTGKFIGVEVKRPGSKLRPEQAEFGAKLVMNNAEFYVVHSVAELAALKDFGSWKTAEVTMTRHG